MSTARSVTVTNTFSTSSSGSSGDPGPTTPTTTPTPPAPTEAVPPKAVEQNGTVRYRILFAYGSTSLTKAERRQLRDMVSQLPSSASVRTTVVGVVRASGATDADRRRALDRAQTVASYLKATGLTGEIQVSNKGRTESRSKKARAVLVTITYTVRR